MQKLKGARKTDSLNEHSIQNAIRLKLSELGFYTERINVGSGFLISKELMAKIKACCPQLRGELDRVRYFSTGAVKGRSDLSAIKDGRVYFLEVKDHKGRASKEQLNFISQMQSKGCIAGIVRSVDDAVELVSPKEWQSDCGDDICPYCGYKLNDSFYRENFCPKCGKPLIFPLD